ncbi:hypothetical protein SBOR_9618 [Sclerotinia borealis F-4128]|uniref:J domain-containing protein n=1 Tax=Sclerotinia borealis (strain F-4128) TaxID=1432307 RepID=W9C274_SCLBF|nr:hypothetical protein SBOR_9618 [Sclerotinia borealis F-4128]
MAPVPITDDYYMVIEIAQTATREEVVQSYRRLAKKIHPDRNTSHDATAAFQLLGKAYETLEDESKRRAYDLIYPSIPRSHSFPQATQTPRTQQSETLEEASKIAALQKSKQERAKRWQITKGFFDSSSSVLHVEIRRLEQQIKNLEVIMAAEVAKKAQENSWGTWLLSPIYKKAEDTEEEKERKDRERQEIRIEKDMKERRLDMKRDDLKKKEILLKRGQEEVDAADLVDDRKLQDIRNKIWLRENKEREEKERLEREKRARERQEMERLEREKRARERQEIERVERELLAKIRKQEQQQQEKWRKEEAEALRKQEEEGRKRQKIFHDENRRYREKIPHLNRPENFSVPGTSQSSTSLCRHYGWWQKVQGRKACPKCSEVWTYLLQCPSCKMEACPKCQAATRGGAPHSTAKYNRRAPPRVRTPSPVSWDDY